MRAAKSATLKEPIYFNCCIDCEYILCTRTNTRKNYGVQQKENENEYGGERERERERDRDIARVHGITFECM